MKNVLLKPLAALLPAAMMLWMPLYCQADDYHFADVNHDGEVNLSDVNAVIDVILGKELPPAQETKTFMANGVAFTMVHVEGGKFTMGAADDDTEARPDERPTRLVRVSDYYIGQTEVTQELWDAVMGTQPSAFSGNKKPVERVSWEECKEFIRRLNALTGQQFRFPTEAEWEFAARGGNKSHGYKYSGSNNLSEVGWWGFEKGGNNTTYTTQPVALLAPNELGIYDMSGNVFEWCNDWYSDYPKPSLHLNISSLAMEDIHDGETSVSTTFTATASNMTSDVYVTVEGEGFSVSPSSFSASYANSHELAITVTYSGPKDAKAIGHIFINSKGCDAKTLEVRYHCPELEVYSYELTLEDIPVDADSTTGNMYIVGRNLIDNIRIDVQGEGFSVDPSIIYPDENGNADTVATVIYSGTSTTPVQGIVTISSYDTESTTLIFNAKKALDSDTTQTNPVIRGTILKDSNENSEVIDDNPTGPLYGSYRVMRGGAWNSETKFCRNSYRYNREPSFKHFSVGLRLAL